MVPLAPLDAMRISRHEQVVFCRDHDSGLEAIIALHDTTLGPGLGGIRMRDYPSEAEALRDVLRLSEAMTLKSSLAGLSFGGGKAVVLGMAPPERRHDRFRALGRFVEALSGRYVPTEDMGTYTDDVVALRETSSWGVGLPTTLGGGGDPSPMTAWGVFVGMRAAYGAAGLAPDHAGKRVVVQGVGKVGMALVELLLDAGAEVRVTDVDRTRVEEAVRRGARDLGAREAHEAPCDVFAPCAGGAILSAATIPHLQCRIVAGGANNQLETEEDGDRLDERKILYAPDFAINAGGLINVAAELEPGGYARDHAHARTSAIEATLARIFEESRRSQVAPARVARRLAEDRIDVARAAAGPR